MFFREEFLFHIRPPEQFENYERAYGENDGNGVE